MNAEEFYEAFKDALKFLGLRWADMHLANVCINEEGLFVVYYDGKYAAVELPGAKHEKA